MEFATVALVLKKQSSSNGSVAESNDTIDEIQNIQLTEIIEKNDQLISEGKMDIISQYFNPFMQLLLSNCIKSKCQRTKANKTYCAFCWTNCRRQIFISIFVFSAHSQGRYTIQLSVGEELQQWRQIVSCGCAIMVNPTICVSLRCICYLLIYPKFQSIFSSSMLEHFLMNRHKNRDFF